MLMLKLILWALEQAETNKQAICETPIQASKKILNYDAIDKRWKHSNEMGFNLLHWGLQTWLQLKDYNS